MFERSTRRAFLQTATLWGGLWIGAERLLAPDRELTRSAIDPYVGEGWAPDERRFAPQPVFAWTNDEPSFVLESKTSSGTLFTYELDGPYRALDRETGNALADLSYPDSDTEMIREDVLVLGADRGSVGVVDGGAEIAYTLDREIDIKDLRIEVFESVLCLASGSRIHAISRATGEVLWDKQIDFDQVLSNGSFLVVSRSDPGETYILIPGSGRRIHKFETNWGFPLLQVWDEGTQSGYRYVDRDNSDDLFITFESDGVHAYTPEGERAWQHEKVSGRPRGDFDGDVTYLTPSDATEQTLVVVDPETGDVSVRYPVEEVHWVEGGLFVLREHEVYTVEEETRVRKAAAFDGSLTAINDPVGTEAVYVREEVADGPRIVKFDPLDPDPVWTTPVLPVAQPTLFEVLSGPAGEVVYESEDRLVVIGDDGSLRADINLPDQTVTDEAVEALSDDVLYLNVADGSRVAIDFETGEVHDVAVEHVESVEKAAIAAGVLVGTDSNGTVVVFDPRGLSAASDLGGEGDTEVDSISVRGDHERVMVAIGMASGSDRRATFDRVTGELTVDDPVTFAWVYEVERDTGRVGHDTGWTVVTVDGQPPSVTVEKSDGDRVVFDLDSPFQDASGLIDGFLLIYSEDKAYCVDPVVPRLVWSVPHESGEVEVDEGRVFFEDNSAHTIVDLESGSVLAHYRSESLPNGWDQFQEGPPLLVDGTWFGRLADRDTQAASTLVATRQLRDQVEESVGEAVDEELNASTEALDTGAYRAAHTHAATGYGHLEATRQSTERLAELDPPRFGAVARLAGQDRYLEQAQMSLAANKPVEAYAALNRAERVERRIENGVILSGLAGLMGATYFGFVRREARFEPARRRQDLASELRNAATDVSTGGGAVVAEFELSDAIEAYQQEDPDAAVEAAADAREIAGSTPSAADLAAELAPDDADLQPQEERAVAAALLLNGEDRARGIVQEAIAEDDKKGGGADGTAGDTGEDGEEEDHVDDQREDDE